MSGFDRVRNVEIGHKNIKVQIIFSILKITSFQTAETRGRSVHDRALDRQNLSSQETVKQVAKTEPQTEPAKEKDESCAKRTKGRLERDRSSRERRKHETESFIRTLTYFWRLFWPILFRSELNSAKSGFYDFRQICSSIFSKSTNLRMKLKFL